MSYAVHFRLRVLAVLMALSAFCLAFLPNHGAKPSADPAPSIPLFPSSKPDMGAVEFPVLFNGPASVPDTADDLDRPELIGIAGRLPDDAQVLLRMPEGNTQSVAIGGKLDGWILKSIAADRAVFEKDGEQMVLTIAPLP